MNRATSCADYEYLSKEQLRDLIITLQVEKDACERKIQFQQAENERGEQNNKALMAKMGKLRSDNERLTKALKESTESRQLVTSASADDTGRLKGKEKEPDLFLSAQRNSVFNQNLDYHILQSRHSAEKALLEREIFKLRQALNDIKQVASAAIQTETETAATTSSYGMDSDDETNDVVFIGQSQNRMDDRNW